MTQRNITECRYPLTICMFLFFLGYDEILKMLEFVDIGLLLEGEWPPFHQACFAGNVKCVELLISHNVNVNSTSFPGENSPLQWAGIDGRINVVKTLIQAGAYIILPLNNGRTSLMEASTEERHIFSLQI